MGGWLSLLVALKRPERLAGLVLIAAAPDFTERMLLTKLSPEDRVLLQREGRLVRPSQYSPEPSVFTWKLIEEGPQPSGARQEARAALPGAAAARPERSRRAVGSIHCRSRSTSKRPRS
jgi:pimeloyl-ACP methyl ester carboxylesterase